MKKLALVLLVVFGIVSSAGLVFAVDPGGAAVTNSVDLGQIPVTASESINVTAGNISYTNLSANLSTYRWSGIMGQVSGNIVLGDASSDVLYSWTAEGRIVYASDGTPTWGSLADASATNVLSIANWLEGVNVSDNYTNTFTGASENIGSDIFSSISSDFAQTNGASTWKTYSLWDTTNLVWAGLIEEDGTSYDGTTVDYQMIIPENGTSNNQVATTYNLWVELI